MFSIAFISVGLGVFEACPNNFTGCGTTIQTASPGEDVVFDLKVVFRDGGSCANQAVSMLTLTKDSEVVYVCSGSEGSCNSNDYPRFRVVQGDGCSVDCKYFIDLVLLDFTDSDSGTYLAVVFLEEGDTVGRNITREFELNGMHDRALMVQLAASYQKVLATDIGA